MGEMQALRDVSGSTVSGSERKEVSGIDFSGSQNNTNRHDRERGFGRGGGEVEGDSGQYVSWT